MNQAVALLGVVGPQDEADGPLLDVPRCGYPTHTVVAVVHRSAFST